MAFDMDMPPNQYWYCSIVMTIMWTSTMCSTLFILNMAFERFYSIIRPHKAASFNTVKRAKISIIIIVVVSTLYNIPQLFMTVDSVRNCLPWAKGGSYFGEIYYWSYNIINFILPFLLLLIMNSVIIYTLLTRAVPNVGGSEVQGQSRGQNEGQTSKVKNAENQIVIMLLLVTFGFLILCTPSYTMLVVSRYVNIEQSPEFFAGYYLFFSIGQKTYYTNFGINFYLYVISGQKFRSDLIRLLKSMCCSCRTDLGLNLRSSSDTVSSSI